MKDGATEALATVGLITAGSFFVGLIVMLMPFVLPLMGAFTGWILGFTFLGTWISYGLTILGVHVEASHLYLLGAALGYVGSYFRSSQSNINNAK